MKWIALLGALVFFATGSAAWGQIQVTVQTARTDFLLYERVDLLVTLQNMSNTDILLDNNEDRPWLSFLVSKHNRLPVRPERRSDFAALTLKVGESKTLRVNLTPLFLFREEGDYKAQAVVNLPGSGDLISNAAPFVVLKGKVVWSQERPVGPSERTYSLIRFSPDIDSTRLYLRVESPSENLVYANLALGDLASYMDPEVNFDPQGNIHVLQPIAMGTYLYTRADPDGKILNQMIFKTYHEIPPRLVKLDDGTVTVNGGQAQEPGMEREKLSEGQAREGGRVDAAGNPEGASTNAAPVPGAPTGPTDAPRALPVDGGDPAGLPGK